MTKYYYVILLFLLSMSIIQPGNTANSKEWSMACRLFGDPKARKVGDLLTVIIEEESSTKMDAKNSSKKTSKAAGSMSFGHPKIDDRATAWTNVVIPAWSLETGRSFEGDGKMENKNKFTSKITVRVTDVMPNGNLLIEGKRSMIIQNESVIVIMTGTVRPRDISRDNIVKSSRIADTAVRYASSGPMIRSQKRGLLMSLLNWINPF